MRFLAPVAANFLLLSSAFGFGGLLRRFISLDDSKLDRFVVCSIAGLGIQGFLLFLVGLVRFTRPSILLILVTGAVLGLLTLRQECSRPRWTLKRPQIPLVPAAIVGIILLITLAGGFSEPYGTFRTSDSVAYHYLGPKVWLRQGVITPVLDEAQTAFPATIEVQYAPLLAFGGENGPPFFSVTSFLLMLLVVASLAFRCGLNANRVWWVLALLSAMPAVYRGLYDGMIDVIYACFLLVAARVVFDAVRPAEFALAGLLCGFAMGSKYTGLIAAPLLGVCVLLFPAGARRRFSPSLWRPLGFGFLLALLVSSPWYLRNWIVMGSPIYPPPPLLTKIFPLRYISPDGLQNLNKVMLMVGRALGNDPIHLLMLPYNLTFHTANFESGAGGIGLVPLAFLPFCFRARRWDTFAKGLGLFGFLLTLAWFYTAQESRYLIPAYLIMTIFAVAGWEFVSSGAGRITRALSALTLAVSFLYGLFMIVVARADDVHSGLSSSFAEFRRHRDIPFLESFRYLNGDPSVGKVLILDPFVASYYLDKDYLKPLGRRGEQPIPGIQTPLEALSSPQDWKITHVLDVQSEDGDFKIAGHPKDLTLVFEATGQRIYRVASSK